MHPRDDEPFVAELSCLHHSQARRYKADSGTSAGCAFPAKVLVLPFLSCTTVAYVQSQEEGLLHSCVYNSRPE